MNKDSQHSSESGVKGFLENLPVLGRPILFIANLVGSSMSIARKLRSFFNSSHPSTLGGFVYIIAICSGITALLISAMIEYKIMAAAYNSEIAISSIPFEVLKFFWSLIFGKQTENTMDLSTNMSISFLFPLLTVASLEGSKCIFTLYYHSDRSKYRFWRHLFLSFSGLLRLSLFTISLLCSMMFFAQLMNKPNEDNINEQIKEQYLRQKTLE